MDISGYVERFLAENLTVEIVRILDAVRDYILSNVELKVEQFQVGAVCIINGRIYSDINPKARINIQIGTITLPTPRGTTAVNRLLPSFHAEIGVMHQALIAGEEGGIGKLIVTDKPICPYCGIDIKKLAIALQLDELIVYDMTGKYVFDGTKNEFNNIPPRKLIPRFKINDSTDQIQTQAVTHSAVTIGIFHNFKNLDLRIDVFNENTFV